MSTESRPAEIHAAVFELLPWWVNGTLEGTEAAMVGEHLRACEACRDEVAAQTRLREAIRVGTSNVQHAPQASFERLWSRIEELERDVPRAVVAPGPATAPSTRAASAAYAGWRLAAALVLLVGAAGLGTAYWRSTTHDETAPYRTATARESPATVDAAPRIRAVFEDATTVEELATIVRAAGLTLVAGPTESSVYTLALEQEASTEALHDALVRLREDPRVRFAEPVVRREGSR